MNGNLIFMNKVISFWLYLIGLINSAIVRFSCISYSSFCIAISTFSRIINVNDSFCLFSVVVAFIFRTRHPINLSLQQLALSSAPINTHLP